MAISTIDAAIILIYLLTIVAIGIWMGRGQRNLSDYLLGGRNLPWWALLGSIVATETSTVTFLSIPGDTYVDGGDMRFLQLAIGFTLGRFLVAAVLLPSYFRGELFTAYEVLAHRFGGATKQTASVLFLAARNVGDGLRLYLAGLALSKVLGITLPWCIVIVGVATIIYTFLGGMKAVVWSDCVQFVIYMIGAVAALVLLVGAIPGGVPELLEFGQSTGRWRIFDFRLFDDSGGIAWSDPYTFWAGIFGGAVLSLGTHGTDQMMVQRYLCAPNQRAAGRALVASGFVVMLQFFMFLVLGVALAYFFEHVHPQSFERRDAVFITYIVDHMPVGIVGLTLAAVFSAAMSTLSSSLNSSSSSATNDLVAPWLVRGRWRDLGEEERQQRLLGLSRWLTIGFGVLQIGIGIGAMRLSESVISEALAVAGFTAGILLGVFFLGVGTTTAHQKGVIIGMLCGATAMAAVRSATDVAWPWHGVIGMVVTFSSGWLASRLPAA